MFEHNTSNPNRRKNKKTMQLKGFMASCNEKPILTLTKFPRVLVDPREEVNTSSILADCKTLLGTRAATIPEPLGGRDQPHNDGTTLSSDLAGHGVGPVLDHAWTYCVVCCSREERGRAAGSSLQVFLDIWRSQGVNVNRTFLLDVAELPSPPSRALHWNWGFSKLCDVA